MKFSLLKTDFYNIEQYLSPHRMTVLTKCDLILGTEMKWKNTFILSTFFFALYFLC